MRFVKSFVALLFAFAALALSATCAFAQQSTLASEIYSRLSKGEVVKVSVSEIGYRYHPVSAVTYFEREPARIKVKADFFYRGQFQKSSEEIVNLEAGQRVIDGIFFCDGHTDSQEPGFLFYGSDKSLSAKFETILTSDEQLDAQGRTVNIAISGIWKTDPSVKATLTRESFAYNSLGQVASYMSRYFIATGVSGFPGGTIDALKVSRIIYDAAGRPRYIVYGHFYGPGTTTLMYNIKYNPDNEVIGYSMYMYR